MVSQKTTHEPYISVDSVQDALDSMIYASKSTDVALSRLTLVDEFLSDPTIPDTDNAREFAVQHILAQLITEEYGGTRVKFGLTPPDIETTLTETWRVLQQDVHSESDRLLDWSWLFHRYVRVDLDISPERFASHIDRNPRTLRRYQQRGLQALMHRLTQMEWQARRRKHRRKMLTKLPSTRPIRLLGRDDAFDEVASILGQSSTLHLQITGTPGSGKTIFAQELLRRLINEDIPGANIDDLIWINEPASVQALYDQVNDALLPISRHTMTLNEYLVLRRVAIVVDDTSHIANSQLEAVLHEMQDAAVLCILTRVFLSLGLPLASLTMSALTFEHMLELIPERTHLSEHTDAAEIRSLGNLIYTKTGGNPLSVKLALDAWRFDRDHLIPATQHHQIYGIWFGAFAEACQRLWCLIAMMPESTARIEIIRAISPDVSTASIRQLLAHHILESDTADTLYLVHHAQTFIVSSYPDNLALQQLVNHLVEDIDKVRLQGRYDSFMPAILENMLYLPWINLPSHLFNTWLDVLLDSEYRYSYRMLRILDQACQTGESPRYDHLLAYGSALRRHSRWRNAQEVFFKVAKQAGRSGNFLKQAEAYLELGILLRFRSAYDLALETLVEAEKTALRYQNTHLQERIHIEITQIAIDTGDAIRAQDILRNLPINGFTLQLKAEAALLTGDYASGLDAAFAALQRFEHHRYNYGRAQILIGRLYLSQGEHARAKRHLEVALQILSDTADFFGIARAYANLGVVLTHQEDFDAAETMLLRAHSMQRRIGDLTGLAFTEHNLNHLKEQISR